MRPAKSGSGERISKTVKQRMAEYYHDMLWQNVGELVQQSVLWYDLPGYVHLPFALQHPRICLGLSNVLNDNMYSQFGGKLLRIYHIKKFVKLHGNVFLMSMIMNINSVVIISFQLKLLIFPTLKVDFTLHR